MQNVSSDRMIKLKIEAFDSGIKPLMRHQKPYFTGHESAVIKSLLNLRSQAPGNPIAHIIDEALLDFVDMVDADLATNILLRYVEPYVEERNRYDETQTTGKVPQMSSLVLTLKCLAVLLRKLTVPQIEFNLLQIAPLTITVSLPNRIVLICRHCMMRIQKFGDKALLCVYHYSWSCRTNKKYSKH